MKKVWLEFSPAGELISVSDEALPNHVAHVPYEAAMVEVAAMCNELGNDKSTMDEEAIGCYSCENMILKSMNDHADMPASIYLGNKYQELSVIHPIDPDGARFHKTRYIREDIHMSIDGIRVSKQAA